MRLLVTRPELDGERTAAALRARGHEVLVAPLLRIERLAADLGDGPWAAVAITSANAARAIADHPRLGELLRLPVFTVGGRTAEAARSAGFGDVVSADGDERDLARLIAARCSRGTPLLYLAGEDRGGDLAGDLARQGVTVRVVVIYRAAKAARFPSAIGPAMAEGRLDGVLHFSRRSAQAYVECARAAAQLGAAPAPRHYCLSAQVAEPLLVAGAVNVRIASRPDTAAMLELI